MRILWVGALALLALPGCVVRHYHGHPAPPPPPPPAKHTTVTVHVGWSHVRYSIWAEYYGCTDDEIYYLETCGYDDDDLLVLCSIARRARVPLRSVLWDYDRCGRSLYTVALVYRLDPFVFYCSDVPRSYRCPPAYARAYGYYWRGERPYLTNEECHALVQLQIGLRYYGYTYDQYFHHHNQGVQRADRHVFRTIVVRDHPRCGSGGKNVHETVIVKRDRAWEHRDIKEWEKKRDQAREQVKIRHTPEHERHEAEQAKRAGEAEDRRRAFEEARRRAEIARREREESDKRNPSPPGLEPKEAAGPPGRSKLDDDRKGPPRPDDKDAGRVPPPNDGPGRKGPSPPEPKGPGRSNDDDRKPPVKAEDSPRGPEKAPPGRKGDDAPPPPKKADDAPRGPEKAPPPPPRKSEDSPRGPEKAPPPPRKADDSPRGPEKAPPPPPKRNDDNRKPPPPPQKSEERRGPEKPPPKSSDENKKESGKEKGRSR